MEDLDWRTYRPVGINAIYALCGFSSADNRDCLDGDWVSEAFTFAVYVCSPVVRYLFSFFPSPHVRELGTGPHLHTIHGTKM